MSPVTHFLTGWTLANTVPLGPRDRALITVAAIIPDVDGFGIVPELLTRDSAHQLLWFSQYHHQLHTIMFAIAVAALAFALGATRCLTGLTALLAFHVHLLEDVIGSRGPDGPWHVPYLRPFSAGEWTWSGQWLLNGWQNIAITVAFLTSTLYIAGKHGRSPLGWCCLGPIAHWLLQYMRDFRGAPRNRDARKS